MPWRIVSLATRLTRTGPVDHIFLHRWPPEPLRDSLQSPVDPQMPCQWVVMTSFQHFPAKTAGDDDLGWKLSTFPRSKVRVPKKDSSSQCKTSSSVFQIVGLRFTWRNDALPLILNHFFQIWILFLFRSQSFAYLNQIYLWHLLKNSEIIVAKLN